MTRNYTNYEAISSDEISFSLGNDRQGKPSIQMHMGPAASEVAIVSPACVTNWPRVTGDGNFGTMWGPTDIQKAKFTLDLTDTPINDGTNHMFSAFSHLMSTIDDRLLDFVQNNQLRILGRKNLSRDEVKMLQIRSVRPKYDKMSGALSGHSMQLSVSKYAWDGVGGKYARTINICDHTGAVLPNATVQPGDVVAVTLYANMVYCGVGGDKFGIHWSFEDVQVVCQRSLLAQKTCVPSFQMASYEFAMPYTQPSVAARADHDAQFSEPMTVN